MKLSFPIKLICQLAKEAFPATPYEPLFSMNNVGEPVNHPATDPSPTFKILNDILPSLPQTNSSAATNEEIVFYRNTGPPLVHVMPVENVPTIIPSGERTSYDPPEIVDYFHSAEDSFWLFSGVDSSLVLSESVQFCEMKFALRSGLKRLKIGDKHRLLPFKAFREKHFVTEDLKPLDYFLQNSSLSQNLYTLENALEFESFNSDSFQILRRKLNIREIEFRDSFNHDFYDKEIGAYDPYRSKNGRFRIHTVSPQQAFFLHRSVKKLEHYLAHHKNSALQTFVGLFRVGKSYFAIEDLRLDMHPLHPLNSSVHINEDQIDRLSSFNREKNQNITTWRIGRDEISIDRKSAKSNKRRLLADIKFLEKLFINFENLDLGIEMINE